MSNQDFSSFNSNNNVVSPPHFQSQRFKTPELEEISKMLSEISSGLRILEDRFYNLRKKTQLTDQSLLEAQRDFFKEKRVISEELLESKMKIQELTEEIELMKTELDDSAKQKDFIVLSKYLDFWEPLHFLTRKQAEEIIEDKLRKKHGEKTNL